MLAKSQELEGVLKQREAVRRPSHTLWHNLIIWLRLWAVCELWVWRVCVQLVDSLMKQRQELQMRLSRMGDMERCVLRSLPTHPTHASPGLG